MYNIGHFIIITIYFRNKEKQHEFLKSDSGKSDLSGAKRVVRASGKWPDSRPLRQSLLGFPHFILNNRKGTRNVLNGFFFLLFTNIRKVK